MEPSMAFLTVITFTPEEKEMQILQSVLNGISEICCLPGLDSAKRAEMLAKADVMLVKSFARAEVEPGEAAGIESAKLVQLIFAGVNSVPFDRLPDGVRVAGNAGAFAGPLAEHVLGMVFCLAKGIIPGHQGLAQGRFDYSVFSRELSGGTCGIIGMGGNGAAIACLMQKVGMRVFGVNRSGTSTIDLDFMGTLADMDKVLGSSDVVVLTVPLTQATINMIGRRELKLMKPDAILVNVARGKVVDQGALYEHLRATPSFGAGIDTWWSEPGEPEGFKLDYPFFDLPNLIGSPHKADHVPDMMQTAIKMAAENVRDFLEGRPIRGEVNRADYMNFTG
jgi:phosphoglycerate dehydrogenase-like enzyme